MKGKVLVKGFVLLVFLIMLPASNALASPCIGDFNCDGSVDADDVATFLVDFGRGEYNNHCDPCFAAAPVEKTGQTTSYATGDDGDLEKGVAWPNPRFTDNEDGTVTDNLTGLIWLKNANCFLSRIWTDALSNCNGLANGSCGLTDGSSAENWRLPNRFELESLLDLGYYSLALPNTAGTGQWSEGDPFTNVQASVYWSSSTHAFDTDYAWYVHMDSGLAHNANKSFGFYVWPVRGESPPVVTTTVPPTTTTSSIP